METLQNFINNYIDVKLMIIIVISAYWLRKFFCNVFPKFSMAWKVFLWSTFITFIYVIVLKYTGLFKLENFAIYLITYFFATSFYELAFNPLVEFAKKIFGSKDIQ